MPSNPVLLECVTAPPGPTNATHCLSISISPALLTLYSPFLSLSAAFLLSWNCNRRTKWLANPFLHFVSFSSCLRTQTFFMKWCNAHKHAHTAANISNKISEKQILSVSLHFCAEINCIENNKGSLDFDTVH